MNKHYTPRLLHMMASAEESLDAHLRQISPDTTPQELKGVRHHARQRILQTLLKEGTHLSPFALQATIGRTVSHLLTSKTTLSSPTSKTSFKEQLLLNDPALASKALDWFLGASKL